ncbi:39767_t:CDS:2 [Gigaspora margarita]|uniref:39767_t:CDS:1 n=1 Tax=Gigaspora margarita TaxID=4874 RepID=A0ABN7VSW5_GIGMA|nr:39767_t:CDS:2 [Gigaspora margarita]
MYLGKTNMMIEAHWKQIYLGRITPSWFDDFKKEWKILASKSVAVDAEKYYMIDLTHWVYSCISFLNSRFLICKHLVCYAIEKEKAHNSEGIQLLYSNFKWYTDYPFLILNSNNSQNQPFNILDINT